MLRYGTICSDIKCGLKLLSFGFVAISGSRSSAKGFPFRLSQYAPIRTDMPRCIRAGGWPADGRLAYAKHHFRIQIELWLKRGAPRGTESGLVAVRGAISSQRFGIGRMGANGARWVAHGRPEAARRGRWATHGRPEAARRDRWPAIWSDT